MVSIMGESEYYSRPRPWRRKHISIMLAVFFGPLTWLYTFRKSATNFVLCLAILLVTILPGLVAFLKAEGEDALATFIALFFFSAFICFGAWLWAVIDTIQHPSNWYIEYPDRQIGRG
jgi:hypothetical protein